MGLFQKCVYLKDINYVLGRTTISLFAPICLISLSLEYHISYVTSTTQSFILSAPCNGKLRSAIFLKTMPLF